MGGCSSKPKTAEFEGPMDLQEGKPQDEAAMRSLEAETIGVDAGLKGIDREQESLECEKDDLRDALTETEKHLIAGFNPEDDLKGGMQILEEGDPKHVKQILDKTSNDPGVKKEFSGEGETLKLTKELEVFASERFELHKDSVFVKEGTKELQDSPLPSATQAETVNLEKEPLSLSEKSVEMEVKRVLVESETVADRNEHVTSAKDDSKLQVKPTGPQDETLELSKDPVGGGEELESQKEVYEKKEQTLVDNGTGLKGQCKHIEEANKEFAVLEPVWEDQNAKSEAMEEAAEGVTTSTSVDKKSPSAKASDQQPPVIREIMDCTYVVTPATTAAVSTDGMGAEIFTRSQDEPVRADLRPTDDFQLKDETLDTTLVEGDNTCGKINVGNKYLASLAVVSEEPIHTELPENSAVEVQVEKLNIAVICNGGQLKPDVSSTSDQFTDPQVTATTEKPEAHVKEPAEPPFRKDISAQEISAPDIDEVWEKLASEFERQESLARFTP